MTILHIGWRAEQIYVWGEQDADLAQVESGWSPFDVGATALRNVLKTVLWEHGKAVKTHAEAIPLSTRISSQGRFPVPSYAFLADDALSSSAAITLELWQVTTALLSWRQVLTLLGRCQEKRLGEELFAGEDLLACVRLFRYAGALVAQGKFLPELRYHDGHDEAVWTPVLDGTEVRRFAAVARQISPLIAWDDPVTSPARPLLNALIDHLVRFSVVTTLSRAHAERGSYDSAHDAWFAALRGDTSRLRWDVPEELTALRQAVREWRRPVEGVRAQSGTLLFRLDAPVKAEAFWFLTVVCANNDNKQPLLPELTLALMPAMDEQLLLALGQAGMLFPQLNRAELYAEGFGCRLTTKDAHVFLTRTSGLLTAAGYAVQLPVWWKPEACEHISLTAEVQTPPEIKNVAHALDEKVKVTWHVMLNGQLMTKGQLDELSEAGSPLVHLDGQWVQVDVRQLHNARRILLKKSAETHTARDVVRLALGRGERHEGLEVTQVHGGGWLATFLQQFSGEQPFTQIPPPEQFHGELRPYQVRGFSWLVFLRRWGFGACLADDMGLGKTIQALAFLLHEQASGERRPVLLIGPMSVIGNWVREAQCFAPGLRCLLHHGTQRGHGDTFMREVKTADLVITSYHLLYRDYATLRKINWSGILLDEAQNIKNPDTQQAQAARALQADYRIALTGTPMENHVGDLWSIMDFLNPGMLGKRSEFRDRFFRPIESGTDPSARTRLRRATAPFILRRLKTDRQIITDLPEKIVSKVFCTLTTEQTELYQEVLENFKHEVAQSEGITRRGLILAVLTRLKQVCNHPAHYLGETFPLARRSGKMMRLEEMLEEIFARGESALIFTQYAQMGALIQRHLCRIFLSDMPFLHGGLSRQARERMVESFQTSSQPQAFVLSLKAGGTGLNITRATHVFHYDRWWNPAVEDQATDRAFRIGQTKNVMVHTFICDGTLEDRIDALIEHKTALAGEIVINGEAFLTELSDDELTEVLRLEERERVHE